MNVFEERWVEAYATDSNVLTSTAISLGSTKAAKVRVIMHEVTYPNFSITSRLETFL